MASTAVPYPSNNGLSDSVQQLAAAASEPAISVRTLDWPCCAAPSILQAWDTLAQSTTEPNPFHESWYLLPALRAIDTAETIQMLVYEVDGNLCGMLPVRREPRYYGKRLPHLASWTHPNAFLGAPLVAPGMEQDFWRALLGWADMAHAKGLFLHLTAIPLQGQLHAALVEVLAEQDRAYGVVYREERAMLASGQSPEDYFAASLSGKKRKELRRQLTRLGEQGEVDFVRQQDADGLETWIDDFLALEFSWLERRCRLCPCITRRHEGTVLRKHGGGGSPGSA